MQLLAELASAVDVVVAFNEFESLWAIAEVLLSFLLM